MATGGTLTPQDFCPFAVPAPQFHFIGKPLFAEGESKVWDIAKLKHELLTIANWYLSCSHSMETGPWHEQRTAFGTREANLSDFIQVFQAVSDSDRFRSVVLSRYGSDLCFNLVNRLIADLVRESDGIITIARVEKMTLGEVVELLEKTRRANASDRVENGENHRGERKFEDRSPTSKKATQLNLVQNTPPSATGLQVPESHKDSPVEIFYSYSHKDENLRDRLDKHLSMLKRQGKITNWHDRKIGAGREWKGVIDEHLNSAGVILLLISADFLASDYCYDLEMNLAMDRHERGEVRVIPIILKPCQWKAGRFGKLKALPKDGKAVTKWTNRDEAFTDVARGIEAEIEQMTKSPKP